MLKEVLQRIDRDYLLRETAKFADDEREFLSKVNQLLTKHPLQDFYNISEMLIGDDLSVGARAMLAMLSDTSPEAAEWLAKILSLIDKNFCLTNADLLVQEGEEAAGATFAAKIRNIVRLDYPDLDSYLNFLARTHYGPPFLVGAYLQLELIRRKEENDFGEPPTGRTM